MSWEIIHGYRHSKEPHSWYIDKRDCIKAMARCGSKAIQQKVRVGDNSKWQNIELNSLEREYLRHKKSIEILKQKYGKKWKSKSDLDEDFKW